MAKLGAGSLTIACGLDKPGPGSIAIASNLVGSNLDLVDWEAQLWPCCVATILETLEKAGILVFIGLSYYFYKESKKGKVKVVGIKSKKEQPFLTGITLSLLNMFAIPFFCGIIVTLDLFSLFSFDVLPLLFFILGTVIGTFCILFLYGKFAKKIQQKTGKLTKDINIVLAILTGLVAVFTCIKLFI